MKEESYQKKHGEEAVQHGKVFHIMNGKPMLKTSRIAPNSMNHVKNQTGINMITCVSFVDYLQIKIQLKPVNYGTYQFIILTWIKTKAVKEYAGNWFQYAFTVTE